MKKLLALGLSVAMMASLSAVAFAADTDADHFEDRTDPNTDNVLVVKTTIEDVNSTYTVTIPAEIPVPWGDTDGETAAVSIGGQLLVDDVVTVSLAEGSESVELTAGLNATIDFADWVVDATEILNNPTQDVKATVTGWANVPIAEYSANVNFEVALNA